MNGDPDRAEGSPRTRTPNDAGSANPADRTPIAPEHFRKVLGRVPTGVLVLTACDKDQPYGLVCGSFMSVSLDPPLVTVAVARTSKSWARIAAAGVFCANVLTADQEDIARVFSTPNANRFESIEWAPAPCTGSPLLAGVGAWIDCSIYDTFEAGDHWLVLGEVLEMSVTSDRDALVFHGGSYRSLG